MQCLKIRKLGGSSHTEKAAIWSPMLLRRIKNLKRNDECDPNGELNNILDYRLTFRFLNLQRKIRCKTVAHQTREESTLILQGCIVWNMFEQSL